MHAGPGATARPRPAIRRSTALFTPPRPQLGRYEVCTTRADAAATAIVRGARSAGRLRRRRQLHRAGAAAPLRRPACRVAAAGRPPPTSSSHHPAVALPRRDRSTHLSPARWRSGGTDASIRRSAHGALNDAPGDYNFRYRAWTALEHGRTAGVAARGCARATAARGADAAVGADRVRRRPRDDRRRRRRVASARAIRGLLQLHRLRALGAAAAAHRRLGGGQGRRRISRCSARSAAKTSTRPRPTRSTCASGRGRRATSTSRSGRVPPTFGAFARRTYATDNPLIGYPLAYQYLTSLRPDALPASADELLRNARPRLAGRSFSIGDPTPAPGVPLVSAFRWDTGVQVHAATDIVDATVAVTPARSRIRCSPTTTAAASSPAASSCVRSPGLIVGASAARGPFVSQRRRAARSATRDDATTSRRPPGAPTSSTRATTTCCASRRSSATGRCRRVRRRRRIDGRCARSSIVGRRALQAAARAVRRGALRSSRASATSPAPRRHAAVGRAGHARRGRRRLLDPAQPAAEGLVSAQHARRRRAAATRAISARRSWCSGSDDSMTRTQGTQT